MQTAHTAARLTEVQVIEGFHALLRNGLAEARRDGFLTDDDIARADIEVQIAGPALVLFYAALQAENDPPSIASPDGTFRLSIQTCPPSFADAFRLWQQSVPKIQSYEPELRRDLALILCDQPPQSTPLRMDVVKTAADVKGIALEILQRRTFQTRFETDLQAVLAPGQTDDLAVPPASIAYQPPPAYVPGSVDSDPVGQRTATVGGGGEVAYVSAEEEEAHLSLMSRGSEFAAKAFFAATCLAILEVALTRATPEGIRPVVLNQASPRVIGVRETPAHLRPFLSRLVEVSQAVRTLAEEDDATAVREATEGAETLSHPKLDLLRARLENGMGPTASASDADVEISQLANGINGLAFGMTSLPAFRDRQAQVFPILLSVTSL
ncbi:hypothetical protein BMF94_0211 [Rhodotorula taiwanensis]|uniref:Uncharacterized protein n=1 Tax=Rhodotorula taiwanensis TaxID=741276 RepID=A0A2S5BIL9_9BASI|nr:hypothetical protein BMF94_0211 [Rhodotorula taiwanensis]